MLAIVQREMQVAARRKGTYVFRGVVAGIGLVIVLTVFMVVEDPNRLGAGLFWSIAIASCVFAIRGGAHRAAVSLSEERAQGTLGLLFLTPLKGFDVVLGKFVSASLLAFQSVLVLAPILSVTLLVGGVSGGEVFRMALWAANATFVFLAVCLFISSLTSSEVGANALSFVFVVVAGCWGLIHVVATMRFPLFILLYDPISPAAYVPDVMYRARPELFWFGISFSHCAGWFFIWLCGKFLQRTWQRPEVFPKLAVLWTRKHSTPKRRGSVRILGDSGPLEWLTLRNIYPRSALAIVLLDVALSAGYLHYNLPEGAVALAMVNAIVMLLGVTVHATLAISRAKKSGILELVTLTPISDLEIIAGQIRGLKKAFFLPSLITTAWLLYVLDWRGMKYAFVVYREWLAWLPAYYALMVPLALWAGAYTGAWMALKEKSPGRAVARTIFFTLVAPWGMPMPTALYLFILGNLARQSVHGEFRSLLQDRVPPPPPFPEIQRDENVLKPGAGRYPLVVETT